jgi:hypothetical protein
MSLGPSLPPPPPARPRKAWDIVAACLRAYRRRWTDLVSLAAVFAVAGQVLLELVGRFLARVSPAEAPGAAPPGEAVLVALLGGLAWFAVVMVQQGAVTWGAMRALLGLEPTLGRAARVGLRRLWSVLLISVLSGLSVLVGLLLLVVPGLIIAVRLAVVMPALIVEDVRGRAALRRSWHLVRGRSWTIAGVLALAGLIGALVNLAVSVPLELVGLPPWAGAVASQALVAPLSALAVGAAYVALREPQLAPGEDLAAELERVSA